MGRSSFQKKRSRLNKKFNKGNSIGNGKESRGTSYKDVVKENEKYWMYYRQQELIPPEEWEAFRSTIQTDLPVSFRIQGCHKDREQMMHEMEVRFFKPIAESGDSSVCEPQPLEWYSGAYQTPMTRNAVRSHPILAQLHNFLVTESELGNLSRQEAVSMIPPLLLAPTSDHIVLDMCAAPGSKTTQLLEMMHEASPTPAGMLIANDVDKKRCYMLIHHTLKRFHTANCAVICEDAARLPEMRGKDDELLRFDRVLCDVICSGDGTLRKNPEIWEKWTPQDALGLHRMQISIAKRGADLLKVGGRLVYSTCSMNPIEDEAVVAQLLRESNGSLKLIDCHPIIPKLKGLRGVNKWKVYDRDMRFFNSPSDVEESLKKMICESCFPPTDQEIADYHLEYCMRIVPHHQNTGGFFVALIEKVSEIAFKATSISGPVWKKQKMFKDEPFTFLRKDDERWFDIRDHYGISDHFTYGNLFSRRLAENDANSRQLFFANDAVKNFVMRNMTTVSIQNAGMKMFSRTEQKVESTRFRLSQEGIRHLLPFLNKQKVKISRDDMLKLLSTESTMIPLESLDCKETIRSQKTGSLVLFVNEEDPVCTWVGFYTVAPYITKEERLHMLRMMGVDCTVIELMMMTKRKEKAATDRQCAWVEKEAINTETILETQ